MCTAFQMANRSPNDMGWARRVRPRLVPQQTSRRRAFHCPTLYVRRPSTPRLHAAVPPTCRHASTQGHGRYSSDTNPRDRSARGLERGCIRPWRKAAGCRTLSMLRAPHRRCTRQGRFGVGNNETALCFRWLTTMRLILITAGPANFCPYTGVCRDKNILSNHVCC